MRRIGNEHFEPLHGLHTRNTRGVRQLHNGGGEAGGSNRRKPSSPKRNPPTCASQATVALPSPGKAGVTPKRKLANSQTTRKASARLSVKISRSGSAGWR